MFPARRHTSPTPPNDIAWSEYNHHWAGIIVLVVGLLALAARSPSLGWPGTGRLHLSWDWLFFSFCVLTLRTGLWDREFLA